MPDREEPQPLGPTSVSLDEMEAQNSAPVAPKLDEIKLDGDAIPEEFRGKSVADLVKLAAGFGSALKLSERARENAETMARMASSAAPAPAAPAAPAAEPEPTDEQIAELYEKDPIKAINILNERAIKRASLHLEQRLAPLYSGTAGAVEQQMREKYKDEFAALGNEIEELIPQVGGRERLTTPKAWEDLIAYVRGQPKNFDKLVEARMAAARTTTVESARNGQELEMGFQAAPTRRAPVADRGSGQMDPVKKQIAEELGMTVDEYIRWEKVS